MPQPVSSFPNLGPASAAAFARAGIHAAQDLRALGRDEVCRRRLLSGTAPHVIGSSKRVMGLRGRDFDAIRASLRVSREKGRSDLEAALSFFGVVERR